MYTSRQKRCLGEGSLFHLLILIVQIVHILIDLGLYSNVIFLERLLWAPIYKIQYSDLSLSTINIHYLSS